MTIAGKTTKSELKLALVWQISIGNPAATGEKSAAIQLVVVKTSGSSEDGGEFQFDSTADGDGTGDIGFAYRKLLSEKLAMRLDAADRVISVTGLDAFWETLLQTTDITAREEAVKRLMKSWNDEWLASSFSRSESLLPRWGVEAGSTWTSNDSVDLPPPLGKLPLQRDLRLTRVERKGDDEIAIIEGVPREAVERKS